MRQVDQDMRTLAKFIHVDKWGALGGEPLLHAGLVEILDVVRESGIADEIEVWTNGLILHRQPRAFWKAFDTLVLSRYPGKHSETSIRFIQDKCAEENIDLRIIDESASPNFRTLLESIPTDVITTRAKYASCFFRHFSRVANDGYFYTCCCAPHMPLLIDGDTTLGKDGVKIEGLTETGLRAYLDASEPLSICRSCAGRDTAVAIPWREEKDPELWRRASANL